MSPTYTAVTLLVGAFLIGSIPVGYLVARVRRVDIRTKGSGNVGATNVWRVLGWSYGLPCLALDLLKGLGPTLACGWLLHGALRGEFTPSQGVTLWLGVAGAAMIGHVFTPWLWFNGGKGVATGLGAMLGVYPLLTIAAVIGLVVWGLTLWRTRMVGISSCVAVVTVPITVLLLPLVVRNASHRPEDLGFVVLWWPIVLVTSLLAGLVIYTHRGNIRRTIKGTEHRIGGRGAVPAPVNLA